VEGEKEENHGKREGKQRLNYEHLKKKTNPQGGREIGAGGGNIVGGVCGDRRREKGKELVFATGKENSVGRTGLRGGTQALARRGKKSSGGAGGGGF